MKKIILTLAIGLVVGYGVTSALENAEISKLQQENRKNKQQVAKLTEQVLILQNESRQLPGIVQQQVSKQPDKNLASKSLHKKNRTKKGLEQKYAQHKQAAEHMSAVQNTQVLKKQKVKTTTNGTVL